MSKRTGATRDAKSGSYKVRPAGSDSRGEHYEVQDLRNGSTRSVVTSKSAAAIERLTAKHAKALERLAKK
jgi:hypothetical protein